MLTPERRPHHMVFKSRRVRCRPQEDEDDILCHPVVKDLHKYLDLVNVNFTKHGASPASQCLTFDSVEDISNKTAHPQGRHVGGQWKRMLVCLPKAQDITIHCVWAPSNHRATSQQFFSVRNQHGVTLLDLARRTRLILVDADVAVRRLRLTDSISIT
jgi:hypothetical protein